MLWIHLFNDNDDDNDDEVSMITIGVNFVDMELSKKEIPPVMGFTSQMGFSIVNHLFWGTPSCGMFIHIA